LEALPGEALGEQGQEGHDGDSLAELVSELKTSSSKWLKDRLKDAPEAKNQIAFADVILLNKTDLVSDAELRRPPT